MGVIKRLDPIIANKIAAGEVIEKMANVVKELVENAIDAEATQIDVDLLQSGLTSIQVIDNGHGMDEEDIQRAFERHATSKITSINDLFRIQSLGFRGEAIPSIASISKMTITSNPNNQAKCVVFDNGQMISMSDASFNKGTKVKVEKIFHYTPARFKYIKSEQYELAMIQRLMYQFALSYPNISFHLTNNQKMLLSTSGDGRVENIMASIYGTNVAKGLLSFEGKNRDYQISGFTSKPVINRSNKNYINIIVNHRVIQDPKIVHAILEGYHQVIPKQRYPIVLLRIDVDPILIDVNVHPRKQEIKFSEKASLLDLIKTTFSDLLKDKPIFQEVQRVSKQTSMDFSNQRQSSYESNDKKAESSLSIHEKQDNQSLSNKVIPYLNYIGQYTGTYLLFQNEEGLYMVDQHAAAERIRYERYYKEMTRHNQATKSTIFGLEMDFPSDVISYLSSHLDVFKTIGVDVDINDSKLLVKTVPLWFPEGFEDIYIEAVVDHILEDQTLTKSDLIDELAILLSCKHSLKANHYITEAEANHLISDLRLCKKPYTCPHGRPIIVQIKNAQIEHWFNRVI
jgi:DNA mismatch repair protein MutL